ncbi:MAG: hypothetical protein ABJN34_11370 [Litoreibacter sp.]|uniref:hypothetical protein n=1 Tax=Litoreibacter sp. TaxID=1969459 RepID=UPI003296A596
MGDYTTETIYRCRPQDAALLVAATEQDARFDALTKIHNNASQRVEFRGYNHDHEAHLEELFRFYLPDERVSLSEYAQHPLVHFRTVISSEVAEQANVVLDLIGKVQHDPTPIIASLKERMQKVVVFFEGAVAAPKQSPFMLQEHQRGLASAKQALEQFRLTPDDIRIVYELAMVGGFYSGDGPEELNEMDKRISPRHPIIGSLAQSFGFLKTIVATYEDAADAGEAIVHLQTYGT